MTDHGLIKSVLTDPEIYDRITDDNCPRREDYEFDDAGAQFFGAFVDDQIAGIVINHFGEIHFNLFRPYRHLRHEIWAKVLPNIKEARVFATIPDLYPSIIEFAKQLGFKEENVLKDAHLKNGIRYDKRVMVFRWDS